MARHPADGGENDNVNANASGLLAEVAALRQPTGGAGGAPAGEPSQRAARAASEAATFQEDRRLADDGRRAGNARRRVGGLRPERGGRFFHQQGRRCRHRAVWSLVCRQGGQRRHRSVQIVSSGYKLLVSTPEPKTSTSEAAGLAVTTNEADNPFGLGIRLKGAPALADRSAVLLTTDVNLGEGGRLVLQPTSGNVGIGTYTPNADNKLEVNGKIAAKSLNARLRHTGSKRED